MSDDYIGRAIADQFQTRTEEQIAEDRRTLVEEAKKADELRRWKNKNPPQKLKLVAYLEEHYGDLVVPEYKFHPVRKWRLDWAIGPDTLKVAIEFQGMFGGKAHRSVDNVMRDAEKMAEAQLLGWIYLQVNTASLRDGMAYRWISAAVATRRKLVDQNSC